MAIGVYQIQNISNGKRYIGSAARSFEHRWNQHISYLRCDVHPNRHMQNAYNKYGEGSFWFSILEIVETAKECLLIEQKYIDELQPEYNACPTAGSQLGFKHSDETKHKCRLASLGNKNNVGKTHSDEAKAKMRAARLGKKLSDETRKRMGDARRGIKLLSETCKKIAASHLGKLHTEETKQKISAIKKGKGNYRTGTHPSEETREKMRIAHLGQQNRLGKLCSVEAKARMSAAHLGKKRMLHSEATKKKISESEKRYYSERKGNQ